MFIIRLLILPPQSGLCPSLIHLSDMNSILAIGQGFSLLLSLPLSIFAQTTVCTFGRLLLCET